MPIIGDHKELLENVKKLPLPWCKFNPDETFSELIQGQVDYDVHGQIRELIYAVHGEEASISMGKLPPTVSPMFWEVHAGYELKRVRSLKNPDTHIPADRYERYKRMARIWQAITKIVILSPPAYRSSLHKSYTANRFEPARAIEDIDRRLAGLELFKVSLERGEFSKLIVIVPDTEVGSDTESFTVTPHMEVRLFRGEGLAQHQGTFYYSPKANQFLKIAWNKGWNLALKYASSRADWPDGLVGLHALDIYEDHSRQFNIGSLRRLGDILLEMKSEFALRAAPTRRASRQPTVRAHPRVDVVLLTALKDEFDQVLKVGQGALGTGWWKIDGPSGHEVWFQQFATQEGASLGIATTWATDMGMVATTNVGTTLVSHYEPSCIAMSGICAGRRGKVSLGDVIFADMLWQYDAGKLVVEIGPDGKRVERYKGDGLGYHVDWEWRKKLDSFVASPITGTWRRSRPRAIELQEMWLMQELLAGGDPLEDRDRKRRCPSWSLVVQGLLAQGLLKKRPPLALTKKGERKVAEQQLLNPDGLPPQPFRAIVGPIATGNRVVEDPTIFTRLSLTMRKVLGLEMEACAVHVIAEHAGIHSIVAKGVSDHADTDKDDRYRRFAARASAECLIGFLRA